MRKSWCMSFVPRCSEAVSGFQLPASSASRLLGGQWRKSRQPSTWNAELAAGSWERGAGSWELGAGSWELEAGSWELEAGSWELEAGSWKLEAGSGKREA